MSSRIMLGFNNVTNDYEPVILTADNKLQVDATVAKQILGSDGNVQLGVILQGTTTTELDVSLFQSNCVLFYEDTSVGTTDKPILELSVDGVNFYEANELYVRTNADNFKRVYHLNDLNLSGVSYLRLRNASLEAFGAARCTLVGSV